MAPPQLDGEATRALQCRNVPRVPFNGVAMHPTHRIFAIVAFIGIGAQAIRFLSAKRVLWLDRICGGALLALSGSLALYRRQA
jgi:hypothetical protein